MAIRTLVAAAALFAATTPAFAQDQTITIENPTMLENVLGNGGFASGITYILVGAVVVAIVTVTDGKTVINTTDL